MESMRLASRPRVNPTLPRHPAAAADPASALTPEPGSRAVAASGLAHVAVHLDRSPRPPGHARQGDVLPSVLVHLVILDRAAAAAEELHARVLVVADGVAPRLERRTVRMDARARIALEAALLDARLGVGLHAHGVRLAVVHARELQVEPAVVRRRHADAVRAHLAMVEQQARPRTTHAHGARHAGRGHLARLGAAARTHMVDGERADEGVAAAVYHDAAATRAEQLALRGAALTLDAHLVRVRVRVRARARARARVGVG
eukprot:scaffold14402_cov63-Phaeocystis_antarctica.AAC.1